MRNVAGRAMLGDSTVIIIMFIFPRDHGMKVLACDTNNVVMVKHFRKLTDFVERQIAT